ncbi:hypothetical protein [Hymenobacter coccineus]|uniref:Lipoprotein n=1 Tax=Hymenobacter coccineus TaxID=1908235 RepID=A0A1G1TKR7_9BACT|nr:hypothetical protein [Hymenobacter coccineus]OGX91467.1 hypothetical protein BEN49_19630 [Hymenobacter coccineus]
MNRTLRLVLVLLGTAPALTACDYRYSPGHNPQLTSNFSWTPTWHTSDVSRDSISDRQRVEPAGGEGSAADIKKGGVKAQLNSAPAGSSVGSPESANGKLAPVTDQSTSNSKTPVDKNQAPK